MVAVLGLVGLTGCGGDDGGDDGGGDGTETTETTATETDDGAGDDGSTETTEPSTDDGGEAVGVEGYCEAVNRYISLLGDSIDDPGAFDAELEDAANDMATALLNLGELSAEEQARFDECQAEAADAANDIFVD